MNVIVAGGRDFSDWKMLYQVMDAQRSLARLDKEKIVVLSSTERGAAKLGESWAKKRKLKIKKYLADWDKYGKSAGYRRNAEMVKDADYSIVFWDGKAKYIGRLIDLLEDREVGLTMIMYNQ